MRLFRRFFISLSSLRSDLRVDVRQFMEMSILSSATTCATFGILVDAFSALAMKSAALLTHSILVQEFMLLATVFFLSDPCDLVLVTLLVVLTRSLCF
ncbi:hypothetical protein L596_013061 [Steinernema carpocapsae]|uniref:Uncharacterized protein n=1 Tax=Steinernema carpocapsae TaxID=34508 RepID=A0A4U5NZ06_STECR|nr:hypothetical protein L596_013061 [Steinernema carpocapsae]